MVIIFACDIHKNSIGPRTKIRLEKGLEIFERLSLDHKRVYVLVTGGLFEEGQTRPAAQSMKDWFIKRKVPLDKIITEEQSIDTYENVDYSLKILQDNNLKNASLYLVSERFHLRIIKILLKKRQKSGIYIPVDYLSLSGKIHEFFRLIYTMIDPWGKYFLATRNKQKRIFKHKTT